jgi:hypothetical protein
LKNPAFVQYWIQEINPDNLQPFELRLSRRGARALCPVAPRMSQGRRNEVDELFVDNRGFSFRLPVTNREIENPTGNAPRQIRIFLETQDDQESPLDPAVNWNVCCELLNEEGEFVLSFGLSDVFVLQEIADMAKTLQKICWARARTELSSSARIAKVYEEIRLSESPEGSKPASE